MTEFKIENDVPMPTRVRGRRGKYPFAALQIGESFFVPGDAKSVRHVRNAACAHARKHGGHFRGSMRVENGVDGIRVWRVAADAPANLKVVRS